MMKKTMVENITEAKQIFYTVELPKEGDWRCDDWADANEAIFWEANTGEEITVPVVITCEPRGETIEYSVEVE